jgi:hypothetical protein
MTQGCGSGSAWIRIIFGSGRRFPSFPWGAGITDPDPHWSEKLDPNPDPLQSKNSKNGVLEGPTLKTSVAYSNPFHEEQELRIRIRNKVNSGIRLQLWLSLLSIYYRLEEISLKKFLVAEGILVNCYQYPGYNFNPISQIKKGNFQGILYK